MTNTGWRWGELELNNPIERVPVPIVSDAAIATHFIKGSVMVPLLVLDTSSRPDIEHLIRLHVLQQVGECKSIWGRLDPKKKHIINLMLQFSTPERCTIILEFDILKQGGIVDQIIQSEAVYLYPGRVEERSIHDPEREKILVEVPSQHFAPEWERLLDLALQEDGRKKGLSKRQAAEYAQKVKKAWRRLGKGFQQNK